MFFIGKEWGRELGKIWALTSIFLENWLVELTRIYIYNLSVAVVSQWIFSIEFN